MLPPLKPVDEVLAYLLDAASVCVGTQTLPIIDAAGRVLAQDMKSDINVPQADNSAMDGYALNLDSVMAACPLPVTQRISAGGIGNALQPGTLARIFTGALIPPGADAVVMQEHTSHLEGRVVIDSLPRLGQHIRRAGQDINAGDIMLRQGRRLKSQDIGLLAAVGITHVRVYKKLKVAVLSTGDELIQPGEPLEPGQVYNSNQFTLVSMIRCLGLEPIDLGLVKDTAEDTLAALTAAESQADCILATGGVSVGEADHVKASVETLGNMDLWRIAIKPGKPLAFGRVGRVPFFGLPGNPVSTFVTFMMIARPYLLRSQGNTDVFLPRVYGQATFSAQACGRRQYYRVRVRTNSANVCLVEAFGHQGSGILSSTSWANGLAEIEIGEAVNPGNQIKVYLLPEI